MALTHRFLSKSTEGMEVDDAQWFRELVLMANNKAIVNVTRGSDGFGGMSVEANGKRLSYDAENWINKFVAHTRSSACPKNTCDVPLSLGRLKKHVGDRFGQELTIETPQLKFGIQTMPALKFKEQKDQVKYGHLNLKFEGAVPASARGLLAQLAGKRELTDHAEKRFQLHKRSSTPKM